MSAETYSPCRLCGSAAHVPPPVDAGTHQHHQVACNECGIEVTALSAADALQVWNRLMAAELNGAPAGLTPRVDWRVHYSKCGNRFVIADTFSSRNDAQRAHDRLSAEDGVSDVVVMKLVTFEFPA